MAETDDLILRLRAQGARQASRDVDRTSGSVRGLGKQSNVALRSVTRLGGGLRAVGAGMAAVGLAGATMAVVLGKQAITAASDLNEEVNKTQAVFGRSSGDILKWSKNSASAFGQSRRQALGAAGAIGSLLVPMGFAQKDAATMSKRMVTLAGDMASFSNTTPQEALEAIQSGLVGEQEPLRKYGISLNDNILKQKAMSMGLYSGKGNLDASAKAAATYRLIIDRLNKSHTAGDFNRTRNSFANQIRVLSATWENMKAAVGAPLLALVNRSLKGVIGPLTHVSNVASDVFSNKKLKWDQKIRMLGASIRHWFGPIASDMVAGLRAAHLDQKLDALIRSTAPRISAGFAYVAPIALHGFITGFKAAPAWAQFLTVAFLASKLGVFRTFGSMAGGAFCKPFAGPCFGAGSKAAWAARGARIGPWIGTAAGVALASYALIEFGKAVQNYTGKHPPKPKPVTVGSHKIPTTPSTQGPGGSSLAGDLAARILGGKPVTDPGPSRGGGLGPAPIIELHTHTHLDGKEVAHTVRRQTIKARATR